jgi:hypothetical protein
MRILMLLVIVLGCVAFHDVEQPNEANLDNMVVVEKKPIRTVAELDAWAETARH